MPNKLNLTRNLKKSIATNGERAITKFLKNNPDLVLWKFCWTGGHTKFVLNEFQLGNQYKVDFVVLLSYSGNWEVNFIELENTEDKLITKQGIPTKRLNTALSQVKEWKQFVENNRSIVLQDLSRACMKSDLIKYHSTELEPSNYSGQKLKDPDSFVRFTYNIIIGRRESINAKARQKINQFSEYDIKIMSFDGFIDIARKTEENIKKLEKLNRE
ncbi:DUF4263 domain-containing protein [Leptospira sp. FAT2]|uniref:Shedu anti-phage system protein SduA domain-containing protein n=1 Tax=Leptospira sanjuanensis TaxID=2879643 RepID=UPI001EE7D9B9|nr:Shedu anti-phage system protein SduA domain-containing protein [Leptospira sanjuanensis]MCG6170153.1 DUF4263 domain-containing protein [Leptospira sanjuanensis]MCG6195487.1 DUF4263 domain-containing protein [Leptospira sanjuanensis]MCG6195536.1 DUF4263 domain-containing protein [Leptospira sanjuanensis]